MCYTGFSYAATCIFRVGVVFFLIRSKEFPINSMTKNVNKKALLETTK